MTSGRSPPPLLTGNVRPPMDVGFRELEVEGTPVLEMRGDVDLSTLPTLYERVNRFAAETGGRLAVIDLARLGSFDPVAVGVLVAARLQLRAAGGELELVWADTAFGDLFLRSGLDATFHPHASALEAVATYRSRADEAN
jgi:anti-anti-sigma factor